LLNSLGKQALSLNIESAGEKVILPLKDLPDGIYVLQIQTSIGIKSEKIIIGK